MFSILTMPGDRLDAEGVSSRAAVIGTPIEHSLSPVLHNAGYTAAGVAHMGYGRIQCDEDGVGELLGTLDDSFVGLSVTMPCKFAALAAACFVTDRAATIGSANTLVRVDGGWRADNTDCDGIAGCLEQAGIADQVADRTAVVVGAGGTSRPAVYTLAQAGAARIVVVNRSNRIAEIAGIVGPYVSLLAHQLDDQWQEKLATLDPVVVISTIPAQAQNPLRRWSLPCPLVDVIYDPWPTPWAHSAMQAGVPVVSGHHMLACQAFGQFEQFTHIAAPRQAMVAALERALGHRE